MSRIVHFDISADNIERAKNFYKKLFGWKIEKSPGPVEYFLIETHTSTGEKGVIGGIAKREKAYQKITNFIEVASIDESITKVITLGGKIIEPKTAISTVGYIAGCIDTEDNVFGIIEIDKNLK
jgi:predicted enzyme related to lactoylglutathione lyase